MKRVALALCLACIACGPTSDSIPFAPLADPVEWDDGDSGSIGPLEFRLANVDAPETGGVGALIGGALCETERAVGALAKVYMAQQTDGAVITFEPLYQDRHERMVGILYADGRDVRDAGAAAGYLRPWPHGPNGERLDGVTKPDWCSGGAD